MLAPVYVRYLSSMIPATAVKFVFVGLNDEEQQRFFLAALLLSRESAALEIVNDTIKGYGDVVCSVWHKYYEAVKLSEKMDNKIDIEVSDLLNSVSKGPN